MSLHQPRRRCSTAPRRVGLRTTRTALILASVLASGFAAPALADYTNITGRTLSGPQNRLQRAQMEEQHLQTALQRQAAQAGQNYNNVVIINQSGNNNYLNLSPVQTSSGSQGVQNSVSDGRKGD